MDLRQTVNNKPRIVAVTLGVLVLAAVVLFVVLRPRGGPRPEAAEAFYSVDDGQTWFAAAAAEVPPFDHDGRQAVRAYVYRCVGGTAFVNHLERFKPEARQALDRAAGTEGKRPDAAAVQRAYLGGREVKRPGGAKWTSVADFRAAAEVVAVKCPDGTADATPVEP